MSECDSLAGLSPPLGDDQRGFKHNLQAVRLASELTSLYEGLKGLNLSNYTLWGIENHTGKVWKKCDYASRSADGSLLCNYVKRKKDSENRGCLVLQEQLRFYDKYKVFLWIPGAESPAWSFEAFLVKWADEIAQRHHDIEDGIIAGVIEKEELRSFVDRVIASFFNREEKSFFSRTAVDKDDFVPRMSRIMVGCLNRNLIENSVRNLRRFTKFYSIRKYQQFASLYPNLSLEDEISDNNGKLKIRDIISFDPSLRKADEGLHEYLKNRILNSYEVQRMDGKANFVLRQIAKAYLTNPQQLPNSCVHRLFSEKNEFDNVSAGDERNWLNENYYSDDISIKQSLLRIICDHLARMTDEFALKEHEKLYSSLEYADLRHY
jgi:dGTPase